MKAFVILIAVASLVNAGVRELSPQEEQEALELFARICGSGSEGTSLGDTLVYCKRARGEQEETLNHQVQVNGNGPGQNQVVFVQPPPVKYLHRVAIQGSAAEGQQAKIYVLPAKASHTLQAEYQGGSTKAAKPVVYFLKGEGGANGGNGGGNNGGGSNGGGSNGGGYPSGGGSNGGGSNGGGYQQQQQQQQYYG